MTNGFETSKHAVSRQVLTVIGLGLIAGAPLLAACSSQPPVGAQTGQSSATSGQGAPAAHNVAGTTSTAVGQNAGAPSASATAGRSAPTAGTGTMAQASAGMTGAATAGTVAPAAGHVAAAGAGGGAGAAGSGSAPDETCMPPMSTSTDPCTAPLKPNDDRLCKMMIGGQQREFYLYASPKFNPCKPASLIMDCHGLSESIDVHTGREGFNLSGQMFPKGYGSSWRMAVKGDNAIVVTPAGLNQSWTTSSDVPFVNKVADQVEMLAKVDPEKVYVTGISMGGMMTVATGCDNAKRWRGMAPVAMLSQSCSKLERPTPTISFHSMTDMLTSYDDDRTNTEHIAKLNNCKMGPTESLHFGGPMTSPDAVCFATPNGIGDPDAPDPLNVPLVPCASSLAETKCLTWSGCDDGVEVVFCTVPASKQPIGGHILYNNDGNLDLSEVAWPFFKKFWK